MYVRVRECVRECEGCVHTVRAHLCMCVYKYMYVYVGAWHYGTHSFTLHSPPPHLQRCPASPLIPISWYICHCKFYTHACFICDTFLIRIMYTYMYVVHLPTSTPPSLPPLPSASLLPHPSLPCPLHLFSPIPPSPALYISTPPSLPPLPSASLLPHPSLPCPLHLYSPIPPSPALCI